MESLAKSYVPSGLVFWEDTKELGNCGGRQPFVLTTETFTS